MGNEEKLAFGHTLAEVDNGMPNSILTDCEAYGMVSGCDENCPVLIAGKCELQDTDNKDLYFIVKAEGSSYQFNLFCSNGKPVGLIKLKV